ncbi:hypothetical protein FOTG_01363 [Fusarium oxysporum f. sp. vasinfectum 25433]|uniref:Uncharacterized protein n=1 Tax=Fusarium oxysporum f. sp. vasinfectum 25433 TaxID=1089449 RepID=X0NPL4_FUSOX|nr:hypothetical protein FOTG_01363 [Fusarium oxysporum f. sp. vasinfectum 25433]
MGACSRNTTGRNHTQDDLQAVEMLHSNPKDIPKPTSLLGNLSHEELSATPFFRYYHHISVFVLFLPFYCFTPLFFTLHWGAAIYILIYPICCQRIMTTRHDLDAILHFYGRHFLLHCHRSVSLFSARDDVATLKATSACSDFLPLTFSGGLLDVVTRCMGFDTAIGLKKHHATKEPPTHHTGCYHMLENNGTAKNGRWRVQKHLHLVKS